MRRLNSQCFEEELSVDPKQNLSFGITNVLLNLPRHFDLLASSLPKENQMETQGHPALPQT